jgi:hypothetical protein
MPLKSDIIKISQDNYLSPKAILVILIILILAYTAVIFVNHCADKLHEMIMQSIEE